MKVLCFDEIAPHKGHGNYELVIYAPALGIVLDVLKDRFHVMKNLSEAVTKARRAIQRQATEAQKALLKGCRWWLVTNRENLSDEEPHP